MGKPKVIPNLIASFRSWSGYNDELLWSALWLYQATGTASYLNYAISGHSQYGYSGINDIISWDSKIAGVKVLLAKVNIL